MPLIYFLSYMVIIVMVIIVIYRLSARKLKNEITSDSTYASCIGGTGIGQVSLNDLTSAVVSRWPVVLTWQGCKIFTIFISNFTIYSYNNNDRCLRGVTMSFMTVIDTAVGHVVVGRLRKSRSAVTCIRSVLRRLDRLQRTHLLIAVVWDFVALDVEKSS